MCKLPFRHLHVDCWEAAQRSEGAPYALAPHQGRLGAREDGSSRLCQFTESVTCESSENVRVVFSLDNAVHFIEKVRRYRYRLLFPGSGLEVFYVAAHFH